MVNNVKPKIKRYSKLKNFKLLSGLMIHAFKIRLKIKKLAYFVALWNWEFILIW